MCVFVTSEFYCPPHLNNFLFFFIIRSYKTIVHINNIVVASSFDFKITEILYFYF